MNVAMEYSLATRFAGVRADVKSFDSIVRKEDCIPNFVDKLINRVQLRLVQVKIF
jgi:hypothetical protein